MLDYPWVIIKGTLAFPDLGYRDLAKMQPGSVIRPLDAQGWTGAERSTEAIHSFCQREFDDQPVVLIGHSQGGAVALDLFLEYPKNYPLGISLATPFTGISESIRFLPWLKPLHSLARGSGFLTDLIARWEQASAKRRQQFRSIFACTSLGRGDMLVEPRQAYLAGATNVCIAPQRQHESLERDFSRVQLVVGSSDHFSLVLNQEWRNLVQQVIAGQTTRRHLSLVAA